MRCPAAAANKLLLAGKIQIGWTSIKVEPLKQRPLQCYNCLEKGHTQGQCRSEKSRKETCYNCGAEGHKARGCTAPANCVLCAGTGRPANHRVGSDKCNPPKKSRKKTEKVSGKEEKEAQKKAPRKESVTGDKQTSAANTPGKKSKTVTQEKAPREPPEELMEVVMEETNTKL